eukprot:scaffold22646_cov90-Isochrysis_galbana.AAC.2
MAEGGERLRPNKTAGRPKAERAVGVWLRGWLGQANKNSAVWQVPGCAHPLGDEALRTRCAQGGWPCRLGRARPRPRLGALTNAKKARSEMGNSTKMKGFRRPYRDRRLSEALPTEKPSSRSSDLTAEMSEACFDSDWPSVSTQMAVRAGRKVKSRDESGMRRNE